ncbi:helix-turn-helix transcriptional regulator [Escherichia coli]|nr:helix-turn-helix transcriptional regulator [Escherichia coli]EJN3776874.1 helix-turn-helix transcriptional regulator [Escherichia coli]EJN4323906.1 helix-turn-helix transcriptional regulator [Escherichia coli]EJN4387890.1 helix-turn-helix transcriptional regulator [Escherichia coli]EJN4421759.1 helix-turn-helix transcriptional regulator [Escherichia coli]
MTLDEYLRQSSIKQADFAAIVGVSQGFVSGVITGRYMPQGRKAIEWAKATDWNVTPHELNPHDYPNMEDGIPLHVRQTA